MKPDRRGFLGLAATSLLPAVTGELPAALCKPEVIRGELVPDEPYRIVEIYSDDGLLLARGPWRVVRQIDSTRSQVVIDAMRVERTGVASWFVLRHDIGILAVTPIGPIGHWHDGVSINSPHLIVGGLVVWHESTIQTDPLPAFTPSRGAPLIPDSDLKRLLKIGE